TGRVEQRVVDLGADALSDDDLSALRTTVQRATLGERIADAGAALSRLEDQVADERRPIARKLTDTLVEAMSDHRSDERVVVGGTANLTRFCDSFDTSLKPLLEALEEHVVLLKLLGEASTSSTVTVRIGREGPLQELASTSVVASGYGPGAESFAALGIVGPTRMDYPGTMAAVRAVARYVSTILDEA
ncbi:MAG: heat-inducible transcriptional repressor HrcA, partial [Marmoricola sp.]